MEHIQEDLGPVGPWQIVKFPQRLREYIVQEAQRELITAGELLSRLILAYRDGKLEAPPPSKTGFANEVLDRSIDRIAKLSAHAEAVPKEVSQLAYWLIKADLRGLKAEANAVLKQMNTEVVHANEVLKPGLTHEPAAPEPPPV